MASPRPSRFIEVWRLELDEVDVAGASAVLDGEEIDRAGRFATAELRRRFLARRVALRHILADRLGMAAPTVRIERPAAGKPRLAQACELHFSASHSGAGGLVALSLDGEIGVDIEQRRHVPDWRGAVRHFFHPAEQRHLFAAPDDPCGFLEVWTRKEAVLKASGEGLSAALDGFSVVEDDGRPLRKVRLRGHLSEPADWSVFDLDLGDDYVGALATRADRAEADVVWREYPCRDGGATAARTNTMEHCR